MLQNLQVLWQYLRILHLQVNTFFKYWVNTYEYCHNTCEYWAGEYTLSFRVTTIWKGKLWFGSPCRFILVQMSSIGLKWAWSALLCKRVVLVYVLCLLFSPNCLIQKSSSDYNTFTCTLEFESYLKTSKRLWEDRHHPLSATTNFRTNGQLQQQTRLAFSCFCP